MSDRPPVEFDVVAADSGTEIFLIDGTFKLLKKGVGRETFSVPPGIYKIKARSGTAATERMLIVRPGMGPVTLDPVTLISAMPLQHSAKTHEFHMAAARQAAAAPPLAFGSGSQIVIVVRQWTAKDPPRDTPTAMLPLNPARGLTLRGMSGAVLADVEQLTTVTTTFDPCVAVHLAVNPGAYRLALAYDSERRVEQTLIACSGWQTHVYLLTDNNADVNLARANVVNGAITMRKPSDGFDPDDPMLRLEEIARGALVDNRTILSEAVRSLIVKRDCPPMLALFGAHLLIRERRDAKAKQEMAPGEKIPDVDNSLQLRTIVDNLRQSVGAHPDVEAIALGAGNPSPQFVVDAPPLLRESWPLLLKASAQRPELLPSGSFGSRIAERIWGDGAWLLWLDPDTPDPIDRSQLWQAKAREVLASIGARPPARHEPRFLIPAWLKSVFVSRSRTPFPDLRAEVHRVIRERESVDLAALRAKLTDDQWRSLIRTVGMPKSSLTAWLDQVKE